ncbi:MAG: alpha/beta hydrolase [Jatrophihabitantaceae bacterium]
MPRYPKVWLACKIAERQERRNGVPSVQTRRAAGPGTTPASTAALRIADHQVPVEAGSVLVRVYRPVGSLPKPAHLLVHAGSFVSGDVGQLDGLAREYADVADCAVVCVDYRLAPEHPWPAAPDDVYAALQWLVASAETLGVDVGRISIGGISAGGAIAAAVALMARDRRGPALMFQLLEIPVTDLTMSQPSVARFASGYLLTRAEMMRGYDAYVPDAALRHDGYVSPMWASDLSGLPPTMVLTCQCDPLRDEGEEFGRRLRLAGVPVAVVRARGHVHASTYSSMHSAARYRRITAEALRVAYTAGDLDSYWSSRRSIRITMGQGWKR